MTVGGIEFPSPLPPTVASMKEMLMAWPRTNGWGNPAPSSNPEPSVPGADTSVTNPLSPGSWPGPQPDLEGPYGELVIDTQPLGPEPDENLGLTSQAIQTAGSGWDAPRFSVPGNAAPGSDPAC